MSLSCITCRPLSRSSSEREPELDLNLGFGQCCGSGGGAWSPRSITPPYAHLSKSGPIGPAPDSVIKAHHRKVSSTAGEPVLVRSGGMRRDWSFEDLRNRQTSPVHTSQLGRERRG
ncbi:hypothetical protein IHE45_11G028100 [Dioscorea alata]|uniref:Uncharacterized protein n=1 Tax=Dioscorea alata TaxID=55571 RepID=A0ACB7V5Q6_DIOAL|nr:hypothetical protein IHE45_11G028100 [Dioscorea alata]